MRGGVVAAPSRLAAEAGVAVLRDGGNAVDAAIAVSAVLCVVHPHQTSLGGDGVAMVWPAGASGPALLSGSEAIPALPQLWGRLLERHGTLGLSPLMAAAAAAARDGWVISRAVAEALAAEADWLSRDAERWRLWPSLKEGMTLRNVDLAATLELIGKRGFGVVQFGALAGAIARALERRDGKPEGEGAALRTYRQMWSEPESVPIGAGLELYEPASGAGTRAAALARALAGGAGAEAVLDAGAEPPSVACSVCAGDESGLIVVIVQGFRRPFGSGVVARGTGILIGDAPVIALPAMVGREGTALAAVGAPTAAAQAQVLGLLVAPGADPRQAVAAPRLRVGPEDPRPRIEVTHPQTRALLRSAKAVPMPFGERGAGQVQALLGDPAGRWRGGADPRSDGAAIEA